MTGTPRGEPFSQDSLLPCAVTGFASSNQHPLCCHYTNDGCILRIQDCALGIMDDVRPAPRHLDPIVQPRGPLDAPTNRANEPKSARMADERGDREVQNRANEPTEAAEEGENRANEPMASRRAAGNRANEPNRAI